MTEEKRSDWKRLLEYALSQKCLWDEEKQDWVAPNEKTLKNLVAYIGRMEPSEAKGSDVRAACEDIVSEYHRYLDCSGTIEGLGPILERRFTPLLAARVQAAAVEMRERCTNHSNLFLNGDSKWQCECGEIYGNVTRGIYAATIKHKQHIRALPIPTDALDAMLLKARIEGRIAENIETRDAIHALHREEDKDPCSCFACKRISDLEGQLVAVTQPAPERKEK